MNVFAWLNDQFLKMVWLSNLVESMLITVGIDIESRFGAKFTFLYL
jgi:uncharacterized protein